MGSSQLVASRKDVHLLRSIGQPISGHPLSVLAALFNGCLAVWVATGKPYEGTAW